MTADWNDTKDIMREVEQLFQHDDDIEELKDIFKMTKEVDVYYANNIKDYKDKIKALTSQMAQKEAEVAAPSEAEHAANVKRYLDRKDQIQTHLNNLRDQIDAKRDSISNIMSNISTLKQQISDCNASLQLQDSRTAYAISLYSKISHITWNYKGPAGRLSGHVMNDKKYEINQFDMDANLSQFDIANKLWDIIGESV